MTERNWKDVLVQSCKDLQLSPLRLQAWDTDDQWNSAFFEALALVKQRQRIDAMSTEDVTPGSSGTWDQWLGSSGVSGSARKDIETSKHDGVLAMYSTLSQNAKNFLEEIERCFVNLTAYSPTLQNCEESFLYEFQESQYKFIHIYCHCEKVLAVYYKLLDFVQWVAMPTDVERWEGQRRVRALVRELGLNDKKHVHRAIVEKWAIGSAMSLRDDTFYKNEYPEIYKISPWHLHRGTRAGGKFGF